MRGRRRAGAVARVLAVERLELQERDTESDRAAPAPRGRAAARRASRAGMRLRRGDVDVADPAAGERGARAAEPDQSTGTSSSSCVSQRSGCSHGIVRRASSPQLLRARARRREDDRHARRRHLETDAHALCRRARRRRYGSARCRDCREASRSGGPTPRAHRRGRRASRRPSRRRSSAAPARPRRRPRLIASPRQPPPDRAQEARVVHDAVPAAAVEVVAVVVAVLGDEECAVDLLPRPAGDLVVQVELAVAADHVRDVDSPAVEPARRASAARSTPSVSRRSSERQSSFGSDFTPSHDA